MMADLVRISASLLAADFAELGKAVRDAEAGGCDEIHFDVMDGDFVPNISMGLPVLEGVRPHTKLPIDVHMMVREPARFARAFADAGGDMFTVHVEACGDIQDTIARVRNCGMKVGISIKPATPVGRIEELMELVDRVLVMTVEPGFGGQSFMNETLPKIEEVAELAANAGSVEVAVDGGIKSNTAGKAAAAGATTLISGSGIFGQPDGLAAAVRALRDAKSPS